MNVSDLLGQNMLEYVSRLIFSSEIINVPHDGWAIVSGMGGGAGGCKSYSPGNSAPWGVRAQAVSAGSEISFAIGAGGAATFETGKPSLAGGSTVISIDGVPLMTCQGGDAGPTSDITTSPVAASVIGADYWRRGAASVTTANGFYSGGAPVDIGFGISNISSVGGKAAPKGFHMWPFNLTTSGVESGAVGVGGSLGMEAGIFGGGYGVAVGQGSAFMPGRGGSAGRCSDPSRAPWPGGDGLGYLRLYKRIGG